MSTNTATIEKTKTITASGDNWKVICHNDSVTHMEFVMMLLIAVFNKSETEAVSLTYKIHNEGYAVISEYSNYDIAEQKVEESMHLATAYGYPLKLTVEK